MSYEKLIWAMSNESFCCHVPSTLMWAWLRMKKHGIIFQFLASYMGTKKITFLTIFFINILRNLHWYSFRTISFLAKTEHIYKTTITLKWLYGWSSWFYSYFFVPCYKSTHDCIHILIHILTHTRTRVWIELYRIYIYGLYILLTNAKHSCCCLLVINSKKYHKKNMFKKLLEFLFNKIMEKCHR